MKLKTESELCEKFGVILCISWDNFSKLFLLSSLGELIFRALVSLSLSDSCFFWKFPSSSSKINIDLMLEAVYKVDSVFHTFALNF